MTHREKAYKLILKKLCKCEVTNYEEVFIEACAEFPEEMLQVLNQRDMAWHHETQGLTYIQTIQLTRSKTGMGLREAKEYVDTNFPLKRSSR